MPRQSPSHRLFFPWLRHFRLGDVQLRSSRAAARGIDRAGVRALELPLVLFDGCRELDRAGRPRGKVLGGTGIGFQRLGPGEPVALEVPKRFVLTLSELHRILGRLKPSLKNEHPEHRLLSRLPRPSGDRELLERLQRSADNLWVYLEAPQRDHLVGGAEPLALQRVLGVERLAEAVLVGAKIRRLGVELLELRRKFTQSIQL